MARKKPSVRSSDLSPESSTSLLLYFPTLAQLLEPLRAAQDVDAPAKEGEGQENYRQTERVFHLMLLLDKGFADTCKIA